MGTIIERRRRSGQISWRAEIARMVGGVKVRESRTFDRVAAARAWMRARERELEQGGAEPASIPARRKGATLADAIDMYCSDQTRPIGRTKAQVLRALKGFEIADRQCETITSSDLVDLARELVATRAPQTVLNYLSHLQTIFALARPAWDMPLDPSAMESALVVTRRLGLTSKSAVRTRRPSLDELNRLLIFFAARHRRRPYSVPMHVVCVFALFSTRRQEEITRLLFSDLDTANSRIMVRDMKHPDSKAGNHQWCELPEPALKILQAMPQHQDTIFPYTTDAITAAFTRACQQLEIDDLRFHDLRHEGVSRLFELGKTIPQVASVSGHRSWQSLRRYTHIAQDATDRYKDWVWLDRAIRTAQSLPAIPSDRPRQVVAHRRPSTAKGKPGERSRQAQT